jgi:AcrR family transcriptional regulator
MILTEVPVAGEVKRPVRRASHQTEQAFIQAATELFAEKGYNGTSISDIAARLGLTTASLYYYVDGKQDLLFRVLQSSTENFLTGLEEIVALDVSAGEKLTRAVSKHLGFVLANPTAVAVFLRERRFLPPAQRDEFATRVDRYDRLFSDLVATAMAEGDIRPGDPTLLRVFSLGSVNWLVEWYRPEGKMTPADLHDALLDLILDRVFGLAAAPTSTSTIVA